MMEESSVGDRFLPSCLCKVQLPHSKEHAEALPKPEMPTIRLAPTKLCDVVDVQSKRVQELLKDVQQARAEDRRLHRKFEKEAEQLLKAYKAGEDCDHCAPQELPAAGQDQDALQLQYELRHSRFQLAEVRNQLHSMKRELAAYERLVRKEVGQNANLHEILNSPKWKGRAQEIKRLKSELKNLEQHAQEHKYLSRPMSMPAFKPPLPDVEDLVPREQAEALEKQARRQAEQRGRLEREVTALIEQYGNVSLMYKASLTHNKMLAEELRSLKEQLEKYQQRARENSDLLKDLIAHQMHVRQMVDREAHLTRLVRQKEGEDAGLLEKADELDAAKYKALYESCEGEKCALEKLVGVLSRRLEAVVQAAEEAEKHCEANEARRIELEQMIEAQQAAAAQAAAKPKAGGKAKAGANKGQAAAPAANAVQLPTSAQLDAVREENKFLRHFLLKAIENKVEDLKLYQLAMDNIRKQYADTMKSLGTAADDGNAGTG